MQPQWNRTILMILGIVALLIPSIRRGVVYRMLKNRMIRNLGLKLIISLPFVRERLLSRILPSRQPNQPYS